MFIYFGEYQRKWGQKPPWKLLSLFLQQLLQKNKIKQNYCETSP